MFTISIDNSVILDRQGLAPIGRLPLGRQPTRGGKGTEKRAPLFFGAGSWGNSMGDSQLPNIIPPHPHAAKSGRCVGTHHGRKHKRLREHRHALVGTENRARRHDPVDQTSVGEIERHRHVHGGRTLQAGPALR